MSAEEEDSTELAPGEPPVGTPVWWRDAWWVREGEQYPYYFCLAPGGLGLASYTWSEMQGACAATVPIKALMSGMLSAFTKSSAVVTLNLAAEGTMVVFASTSAVFVKHEDGSWRSLSETYSTQQLVDTFGSPSSIYRPFRLGQWVVAPDGSEWLLKDWTSVAAARALGAKPSRRPETISVSELTSMYTPGDEHAWSIEFARLLRMHGPQIADLLLSVNAEGFLYPISLGIDGRVWDGHHRILVAKLLDVSLPYRVVGDA